MCGCTKTSLANVDPATMTAATNRRCFIVVSLGRQIGVPLRLFFELASRSFQ
jgi:hypothetical protein